MDNILFYVILGGSIGILVYMVLYHMRKTSAYGTVNNLRSGSNEVLEESDDEKDDDQNPGAAIQDLNMKNTTCTDSLGILNTAISKLRRDHKHKKEQMKNRLGTCNVSFDKKLIASKKFRNNRETDEEFLKKLQINRNLFKSE